MMMYLPRILFRRYAVVASASATTTTTTTTTTAAAAHTASRPLTRYFQTCTDKNGPAPDTSPGHVAFADVEYNAMVDLFHHHARELGHLDKAGVKSLLESISQPTEIQNLNLKELTQLAEECRQTPKLKKFSKKKFVELK